MNRLKGNYAIIDTETGGLNPVNNSLLTIAVVMVKDGVVEFKEEWSVKHDTYNVTPYAMKVNKINLVDHDGKAISSAIVSNKIKIKTREIFGIDKPNVIGHNINFDLGFIFNQIMSKKEWEMLFSYRNIDTAGIARFLIDSGKISSYKADLGTLMEYFNVGMDSDEARHTAMYDAECTWEVYNHMVNLIQDK